MSTASLSSSAAAASLRLAVLAAVVVVAAVVATATSTASSPLPQRLDGDRHNLLEQARQEIFLGDPHSPLATEALRVSTPVPIGNLSKAAHQLVQQARDNITWGLTVDNVAAQVGCNTIARSSCDCTFWNGILCSSPSNQTDFACDAMWRDQSPSNGQLWRSPWEAAAMSSSNNDEFSRDQGLGVLTSTFGRVNVTLFQTWLDYIAKHNGYMCPLMYDCLLIPQFWCTFDKVTQYHGLPRPDPSLMTPKLDPSICKNDHEYVYTSVAVDALGSPLHLASLDVYMRRQMGDWDGVMQSAADLLHRRQPQNVWFQWLSQGASDSLVVKVLEQMELIVSPHVQNQWTFVREDSQHAYLESMGWDYMFLLDHLLAAPLRPI